MNPSVPTTLHKPAEQIVPLEGTQSFAWFMIVIPIVAAGVWLGVRRNRQARTNPQEHAFRALARRMKLRQREMHAVRVYARSSGMESPIAVLMDPNRLQDALKAS